MSLKAAQDFVKVEERISGISIKCVEGSAAEDVRPEIGKRVQMLIAEGKFPARSLARTWKEKDQTLLQAVQMEKLLIRMLMFIMVLLAMGSIFVVLYMSVREKARDLGILKALGGTPNGILSIYVGQGVSMSLLGVLLGLGVGLFLSLRVNEVCEVIQLFTGWHPFPPDVYYLDRIPSKIDFAEVLQTVVATTVFAILLSIVPGLWAANLDPIDATRIE
jgi:lipoprotein-releasing system permease protein